MCSITSFDIYGVAKLIEFLKIYRKVYKWYKWYVHSSKYCIAVKL